MGIINKKIQLHVSIKKKSVSETYVVMIANFCIVLYVTHKILYVYVLFSFAIHNHRGFRCRILYRRIHLNPLKAIV